MSILTYREALNQAMREEMRRDETIVLMGEEVGFYQGAYKVSKGMLEEFGPMRVLDTPITELGFTGLGVGAAMVGLRPIVEMMTFNFAHPGARPDRERRGQDALHVGGAIPRPPGDSWSRRRRAPACRTTFAGAGIVVLPRSGIEGGHALDTRGCQRTAEDVHS